MLELLLIVVGFLSLIYGITFGRIEIGRDLLQFKFNVTLIDIALINTDVAHGHCRR